jgi:hypothetical protein
LQVLELFTGCKCLATSQEAQNTTAGAISAIFRAAARTALLISMETALTNSFKVAYDYGEKMFHAARGLIYGLLVYMVTTVPKT